MSQAIFGCTFTKKKDKKVKNFTAVIVRHHCPKRDTCPLHVTDALDGDTSRIPQACHDAAFCPRLETPSAPTKTCSSSNPPEGVHTLPFQKNPNACSPRKLFPPTPSRQFLF